MHTISTISVYIWILLYHLHTQYIYIYNLHIFIYIFIIYFCYNCIAQHFSIAIAQGPSREMSNFDPVNPGRAFQVPWLGKFPGHGMAKTMGKQAGETRKT